MTNVFDILEAKKRRSDAATGRERDGETPLETGGGPPHPPDMDDAWRSSVDVRLGKLETTIDGLRHSQNILIGALSIVGAILVAIQLYTLNRIDGLPAEFRAMNQAFAETIAAAKSAPPQVIIMPAPQAPAQPAPQQPKQ